MQVIRYKWFDFAGPPACHSEWVINSMAMVDVPKLIYTPPEDRQYRVTQVIHPYHWMEGIFELLKEGTKHPLKPFRELDLISFVGFVRSYLRQGKPHITEMFNLYKADSAMRWEDQPWALAELLDSVGAPADVIERVEEESEVIHQPIARFPDLQGELVRGPDALFCDRYDYY